MNSAAGFWRSVGLVLTGTALAQLIPLLGSLLLARLYAPDEFGVFAAWLGAASLAAVAMTGRYEMALPLEPDGEPRRRGVRATLRVVLVAAFALAGIEALALAAWPAARTALPPMLLFALVPTAAAIAAGQVWQAWAAAEGRFRDLGLIRVAQAGGITALQLAAGALAPSAATLAMAHGLGALGAVAVAAALLPLGRDAGGAGDFRARHRRFPLLSLPADTVNTAASQLPLLIVASRFGAEVAGLLALAMRTLGAPIALLGAAVLDVFRRRAAASFRERGECRAEYLQTLAVLAAAATLATLAVVAAGEPAFAFAFGEPWRASGTIAIWLMPMFALRFVASPLSYLFYVAGKQHVDLMWQVSLLATTLATLLLPAQYPVALRAYAFGYSALYIVYLVLTYRFSLGSRR